MIRFLKNYFFNLVFKILHSPTYQKLLSDRREADQGSFKFIGNNCNLPKLIMLKNPQYISIGDNFQALYNLRLEAWDKHNNNVFIPEIIIGNNVSLNSDVHIAAIEAVTIGNNVLIASRVYISDHSHGGTDLETLKIPPSKRLLVAKPINIEDNVWIGEGACILPGVTIGKNSIIGANAVVTKSFPPFSVIAGVPAKTLIKNTI